jgi:major membrane immunogen (membrane-anchored lipoprotein)
MKRLIFFVCVSLLLTGCSSSTNTVDQIRVLEYEKCLDYEIANSKVALAGINRGILYDQDYKYYRSKSWNEVLENCSGLRP